MITREWRSTARQAEFLLAQEDEALYGGAAGGGKTDALLALCAVRCGEVPGAHVLFLRRAFPDLEMSAIRRSLELFSGAGPTYNSQAHRWTWPNNSVLQFGYLERDEQVYRYQSAEFDLICFDELTQFSEWQYTYMLSRNRTSKPGVQPAVRAATNPGGIGHHWVRARFIDAALAGRPYTDQRTGRTRRFVPAKVQDNPYLIDADPGYMQRLAELPDAERRALAEGDWDVFAGAMFGEWRRELHVVSAMPEGWQTWRRFMSMDWGRNAPGCALWWATSPDRRLYIYRECYFNGGHTPDMDAYDAATAILALEAEGETASYRVADPSMWAKTATKGRHGDTMADDFRAAGCILQKADNDRINGVNRVHALLKTAPDGLPWVQILDTCQHLIRTLPALPRDRRNIEDVDTDAEDHAYDAFRYGAMSRPAPGESGGAILPGGVRKPHQRRNIDEFPDDDDDRRPRGPRPW